jgi:RNA polymerase sigma-70 factor, ECF subfamily
MAAFEMSFQLSWVMDGEIVTRAQHGDNAAFDELVVRHEGKLRSVALRLTGSMSDAEDVVQQSLMKAFEKIRNFRGDSQFSTWVTRIVLNESLMFLRRRRREAVSRLPLHNEEGELLPDVELADSRPDPEARVAQDESAELLRHTIKTLPKAWRSVIVLHDIEGQTIEETANRLGISVAAAKSRRLRARLELGRRIESRLKAHPETGFARENSALQ